MKNDFGNKIKSLLENNNISQKKFAEKIGITEATLSRYINNLIIPKIEVVSKMATLLDVSTDYLLGNEHKMSEIEEKEVLKRMLIKAGYMKKGEDISDEKLDFLIKFIGRNKDLFKGEK